MNIRFIIAIVAFFILSQPVYGQIPTEASARQELKEKGIDEAELRAELAKRGVNLDQIDPTNASELARTKVIVEEVMAELEAKARAKKASQTAPSSTGTTTSSDPAANADAKTILNLEEDIKDAVKDGATIDEAISEEIQEKAKEKLPTAKVYGHHVFRNSAVKFYRKSEDAKPPANYIIGPGDRISVAIWGESELNYSETVSSDGFLKPDKVARIYVTGLTIKEAKETMKRKFLRFYRFTDNTFEVNVTTSRIINVNITGEVFNVGSYSLSALNTAFNALVAAGGPADIGSVRNILIARAGEKTRTLDIYKYLLDPMVNDNLYLNENDYIIVPVAEKVVRISGAINRPFKYELLPNENLTDLFRFAGGLKANALKRSIQITRIENDATKIINVDLNELERTRGDFKLKNGDIIDINEIDEVYKNTVTINGAVELPGQYAYVDGMKISDLLEKTKLKTDAILGNAYLMRLNPDEKTVRYEIVNLSDVIENPRSTSNLNLQRGDVLNLRSRASFVDRKNIQIAGAVRNEGNYPFNGGVLRVSDAIFLSGGLTESATDFAFIFRDKEGRDAAEYINVDLGAAMSGDDNANRLLQPGDKVIVYDRNRFLDQSFVSVSGAVKDARDIKYDTSLTIKKTLLLAGGLTFDASLQQIDIFRLDFSNNKKTKTLIANISVDEEYNIVNGSDFKLRPFDQIIVRKAPEFELVRNVQVVGEVKYPGKYALISDNMKLTELIKLAGGYTDESFLKGASLRRSKDDVGFIIVDLERAIRKPNSPFNAILQQGDVLTIPKRNELVTVTGAVLAGETFIQEIAATGKYNFVYEEGKNAKYYIDKYAGGIAKNGRASKITVTYPNGEVKKTKKVLFWNDYPKVEPGSIINVGFKEVKAPDAPGSEKEDIDWGKVLSDSVAQATTILTLVILINNLD